MFTFASAYILVWLSMACYVGWMSARQRRLTAQFTTLQKRYSEREAAEAKEQPSLRRAA